MFKLNWKTWLAVWLGLTLAGAGFYVLLAAQEAGLAASWVMTVFNVLSAGWTLFGLYRWREVP